VLVQINEPHMYAEDDAVAKIDGYVIAVAGAGPYIGEKRLVRIESVGRTAASGVLADAPAGNGTPVAKPARPARPPRPKAASSPPPPPPPPAASTKDDEENGEDEDKPKTRRRGRRGGRGRSKAGTAAEAAEGSSSPS
jgi:ribonuclease G